MRSSLVLGEMLRRNDVGDPFKSCARQQLAGCIETMQ
jgi:hypothetical protein